MFLHRKELIQPVKVGKPDARFGTFLLEQFGGADVIEAVEPGKLEQNIEATNECPSGRELGVD